jgi:hypothetical protein
MRALRMMAVTAVLAACLSGPLRADTPDAGAVQAVWVPQQLRFTFLGFTAKYSCDGLQDKVRRTLLKLGARPDLSVQWMGCAGGIGRPTQFPGVQVKMHVLQLLDDKNAAAGPPVNAHWRLVDVTSGRDPIDVAGDCELTEQIKQSLLPKFTARNVEYRSTCIPNQLTVGGTSLKAEVLIADPKQDGAAPAK